MNLFDPRTFRVDWEMPVIDRLERSVGNDKLTGFAQMLAAELGLPIQTDWNAIECPMGINSSFDQIRERIQCVTDRVGQFLRAYDLCLCPAGSHPTESMFFASHVHVGTITDRARAIHLENALIPYAPLFAALSANSPFHMGRRGEYKSYRVRYRAHWNVVPASGRDPNFSQTMRGTDAGIQMERIPTLEVRIVDSCSSRRLLAELTTFVAAFVHHCGRDIPTGRPDPNTYRDSLINRWAAGKYGMQATFRWEGGARPVADILDEMLDRCSEDLAALGCKRSDLTMINQMLAKRTCQADYLTSLFDRHPDPALLSAAVHKLMRHWTVFDEFLEAAPVLDPMPVIDEEAVLSAHLEDLGEGMPANRLNFVMCFPPPAMEAVRNALIERGQIRLENGGKILSRIA
jgi:gamma-glutamyl:cysteine ligase YbdK (ATP-grasp superfamily)